MPVKVFLRPYRGERIEREFQVHVPAGLAKVPNLLNENIRIDVKSPAAGQTSTALGQTSEGH